MRGDSHFRRNIFLLSCSSKRMCVVVAALFDSTSSPRVYAVYINHHPRLCCLSTLFDNPGHQAIFVLQPDHVTQNSDASRKYLFTLTPSSHPLIQILNSIFYILIHHTS